jgi:hypothetical protein
MLRKRGNYSKSKSHAPPLRLNARSFKSFPAPAVWSDFNYRHDLEYPLSFGTSRRPDGKSDTSVTFRGLRT